LAFIVRIRHDARASECQIPLIYLQTPCNTVVVERTLVKFGHLLCQDLCLLREGEPMEQNRYSERNFVGH